MAKVSLRNDHDWLGFTVTFADKTKIGVTWSRGAGEKIRTTPEDRTAERRMAIVLWEAWQKTKLPDAPYRNYGDIQKIADRVGAKTATLEEFLAAMTTELGVTGKLPKLDPGPAANGPVVTMKKSRGGAVITCRFPTGEQAELTINKASVGSRFSPDISALSQEMASFVFAAKGAGVLDAGDLAEAIKTAAENSACVAEWIDASREAVFPSPGMRR
jgi:hypothetical protein